MKLVLNTLILLFFNSALYSQNPISTETPKTEIDTLSVKEADGLIFTKTEVEAEFPGGNTGWANYLRANLNPNVPVDNGIRRKGKYQVIIRFIVATDGSIYEVVPETAHGWGMEAEAIRIIKNGPNWIPAYQNGRKVKAYRRQPITFVVM